MPQNISQTDVDAGHHFSIQRFFVPMRTLLSKLFFSGKGNRNSGLRCLV